MDWTQKEESQVNKMTKYQVSEMTYKQLWIAAEFEKFSVSDLIEQASTISSEKELQDYIEYINSFEDETRSGNWYKSPPTVKY